jgi:hypothetical protein
MDRKPVVECEKRIFGPEKGDFEVLFILLINDGWLMISGDCEPDPNSIRDEFLEGIPTDLSPSLDFGVVESMDFF